MSAIFNNKTYHFRFKQGTALEYELRNRKTWTDTVVIQNTFFSNYPT